MAATRLPASPFPSMWSPPPPVNTPQNSMGGSGGGDKKGSSSSATKPIENPLLTRSPPRFTAATTGNRTPSLTTPPHFMLTNGSPPPNNNNLTLTTTTTTTTMVTGREPLNTVLGNVNDGGSGLRQRKGALKGVATNTSVALNGFTPPPRATLSLQGHMLRNTPLAGVENRRQNVKSPKYTNDKKSKESALTLVGQHDGAPANAADSSMISTALTVSAEEDTWVLVSGVSTKGQRDEVFRIFDTHGRVVSRRSSSSDSNWVAIQYQTRLEAEKALSHQPVHLCGGKVLCAVFLLSPERRRELFQQYYPETVDGDGKGSDNKLFTTMKPDDYRVCEVVQTPTNSRSKASGELQEKDILLYADDDEDVRRVGRRTICDEILAWWFGWK